MLCAIAPRNSKARIVERSIDIEQIIFLLKRQEPDRDDIVESLRKAKNGQWTSNGYYSFVNSKDANETDAEWQFCENVVLEQENKGDIVLDILKDGQVGGIEFMDLIDK